MRGASLGRTGSTCPRPLSRLERAAIPVFCVICCLLHPLLPAACDPCLQVIACIGETLEQRESGHMWDVIDAQLQ